MRLTNEQIDQGILDAAAGVFATYGYTNASLQQIGEAAGYSKAGLAHRFGSKQALHGATVANAVQVAEAVLAQATTVPAGADPTRHALEVIARRVLEHPGVVQLVLRAFDPDAEDPGFEDLQSLGYRLVDVLDRPLSTPRDRLRVVLALQLLVNAALAQAASADFDLHVAPDQLVPMVVGFAKHILEAPLNQTATALSA